MGNSTPHWPFLTKQKFNQQLGFLSPKCTPSGLVIVAETFKLCYFDYKIVNSTSWPFSEFSRLIAEIWVGAYRNTIWILNAWKTAQFYISEWVWD